MNVEWSLWASVLWGSLHPCPEFHQDCLNESTSWQKKLAGITVNPLLRESLLLLLPQMNWHLKKEKEACAPTKIVTGEGVVFHDNWRPPRTFYWCCSPCVSKLSWRSTVYLCITDLTNNAYSALDEALKKFMSVSSMCYSVGINYCVYYSPGS